MKLKEVQLQQKKNLFKKYGVIVSVRPEHRKLLAKANEIYDLGLDIPDDFQMVHLSEKNRRLVLVSVNGLRRQNGSLLPDYTDEEIKEATFGFVKYYVQSRHYDDLVAENEKLKKDLEIETDWHTRDTISD